MNKPVSFGVIRGFLATAVFFIAVLLLTGLGFAYGSLFAIAAEFPVLLTLPFLLALGLAVLAFPVAGAVITMGGTCKGSPGRKPLASGFIGFLVMAALFYLIAGGSAIVDWPGLLYLLQLALPAFLATSLLAVCFPVPGAVVEREPGQRGPTAVSGALLPGTGAAGGEGQAEAADYVRRQLRFFGKLTLIWVLVSMLLVASPFLLLWYGKLSFKADVASRAATVFVLPPGAEFAVRQEGGRVESLSANERYAAGFSQREKEREFTVTISGDRQRFSVEPDEIIATLNITDPVVVRQIDWQDSSSMSPDAIAVLLAIAQPYVKDELVLTTVRTNQPAPEVRFRSKGMEVVARPVGPVHSPAGLFYSYQVPP